MDPMRTRLPVEAWEQYPRYRELLKFVSGVSLVHDPAERYSAPLHLYNSAPLQLCTFVPMHLHLHHL